MSDDDNRTDDAGLFGYLPAEHGPRIVGGAHDGQELWEVPVEWDGGDWFASLLKHATDGQLIAFADLVRAAIQDRVCHYQRHGRLTQAQAMFNVANGRIPGLIVW